MKTRDLTLTVVLAGLYLVLGFVLQNIAFGSVQVRVADALYPLIAILGLPCLVGTFLGHLIFNMYGFGTGIALGVGDLASPFIFLIPKYIIYKSTYWKGLHGNYYPTTIRLIVFTFPHVLFVAFWVAWLFYTLFGLPFWVSVVTVGAGEFIAEIVLGVPLATAIKRRLNFGRKSEA